MSRWCPSHRSSTVPTFLHMRLEPIAARVLDEVSTLDLMVYGYRTFVGGATLLELIAARVLNEVSTLDLMVYGYICRGSNSA